MAIGVVVGNWISKHYGRRWCIFVMSIYALGSVSVIVSGTSRAQMLAGRSIHCMIAPEQQRVVQDWMDFRYLPRNATGCYSDLFGWDFACAPSRRDRSSVLAEHQGKSTMPLYFRRLADVLSSVVVCLSRGSLGLRPKTKKTSPGNFR